MPSPAAPSGDAEHSDETERSRDAERSGDAEQSGEAERSGSILNRGNIRRSRVIIAAVAALAVLIVVAVVVARENRQNEEREAAVAHWGAQIATWESEQLAGIGAGIVPADAAGSIADAVSGTALRPVWPDVPPTADSPEDSLDEVNASCTAVTAYDESVQVAPEPPAPPTDLDLTDAERTRFDEGSAALAELRNALSEPMAAIRQFCGTYPALLLAHGAENAAEANRAVAETLAVQCPAPALDGICAATIDAASALAGEVESSEAIQATWTAAVVEESAVETALGGQRETAAAQSAVAQAVAGEAAELEQQIEDAATAFATALRP
ncbi:hypothetical protein [Ruania halotolerans]|uniref:hypothetical protein n=1 Tax=Ruania halotolerans TaxID=2897773 RepID=UPI001E4981FB|nr:hypothetical protein [Ruania halotolerans]UFU05667.1 hypothetical protein LQF10_14635 [Ruania halotolerans]